MLKSLTPYIAKLISSDSLLFTQRRFYRLSRQFKYLLNRQAQPAIVEVFVKLDDPYSYLLLQLIDSFEQKYPITLHFFPLIELPSEMYPDKQKWDINAFKDCVELAQLYQLQFPDKPPLPQQETKRQLENQLLSLSTAEQFKRHALTIYTNYWFNQDSLVTARDNLKSSANLPDSKKPISSYQQLIKQKGYLAGSVYFEGEWYWGIDRLYHLENRLNKDQQKALSPSEYYQQTRPPVSAGLTRTAQLSPLIMYFSIRSPYSYLGLEKAILLAQKYQLKLEIKAVLPMLMRGLKVPANKKWYIFKDTKREAKASLIEYGFVSDPLGKGVENCYAILEYAKQQNKVIDYLQTFAHAVNAEGVRSDATSGLRKIVSRAGLDWQQAKIYLKNTDWKQSVEKNRLELENLGLWGVPCFRFDNEIFWGQDRLWVIEKRILQRINDVN